MGDYGFGSFWGDTLGAAVDIWGGDRDREPAPTPPPQPNGSIDPAVTPTGAPLQSTQGAAFSQQQLLIGGGVLLLFILLIVVLVARK